MNAVSARPGLGAGYQPMTGAPNPGPAVGVGGGVVALAAASTGELIAPVFWTAGVCERRGRLEQRLARRREGSAGRRDWLHKLSHGLATENGPVAIEKLNVKRITASARDSIERRCVNVRQKDLVTRRSEQRKCARRQAVA